MKFSLIDSKTKKALVLPVPPERMTAYVGTKTLTFEPTVLGDIEFPRGRKPVLFTLEGMFPGVNQSIEDRDSEFTPEEIVSQINEWTNATGSSGKEVRFIVTDTEWNLPVSIRSLEAEYSGGYGDMIYTLDLVEWRPFTVKEVKPKSSSKKTTRPTPAKPKSIVVKRGDTLSAIARKQGQPANKWRELWNANKGNLKSKNPDLIYPGEKITIPVGWLK